MKLGYTIIYVPNVKQAVEFYERCFGLTRRPMSDDTEFAELETGATALSFAAESLITSLVGNFQRNSLQAAPAGIEIVFIADDVQAAFDKAVQKGAVAVSKPEIKPWGQTVSYVRDLNGVLIEIASEIS
jgi:lactoylglutathione lyase